MIKKWAAKSSETTGKCEGLFLCPEYEAESVRTKGEAVISTVENCSISGGGKKEYRSESFGAEWRWNTAVIMKIILYLQQSPFNLKEITIEHIYLKYTDFSA